MKPTTWAAVFVMSAVMPVRAQQFNPQARDIQPSGKASAPACKDLKSIGAAVDHRFDEENDHILAMIRGNDQNSSAAKVPDTLPPDFTEWDAQGNPVHTPSA
jgi:hypothetical protein